ncbi:MAG: NAD(P)-binding domain-containing protein [Emcibacter sp.]|nr:NAD(P)-binding domain-containing protein [Emcibacter sp.]
MSFEFGTEWLVYGVIVASVFGIYFAKKIRREKNSRLRKEEEFSAGLIEPPSLHPVIDPVKCLGCASCVTACPEKGILGIINGKAELIAPTHCIGHGACQVSCPLDAIELVFGTERRGIDIPNVKKTFETNVPGIFIAGELGGMGLIRNAIEQGKQAMDSVKERCKKKPSCGDILDVVIVGAGPSGFSASLAAMAEKMSFVTLEQETFGGTVAHYPRGKVVMTQPVNLPLYGKANFRETTKEKLLEFWHEVREETGLEVQYGERVVKVEPANDHFLVQTEKNNFATRNILLTIGRRGTPRKLNVPGEDQEKVVYRLIDPEQYAGQHVLVVGGGDSALEAAVSISEVEGTTVALSYRSAAFGRAKQKNREKVEMAEKTGGLRVLLSSNVMSISENDITLDQEGQTITIENDAVIVCAGGILPTGFLKDMGIEIETKFGTA